MNMNKGSHFALLRLPAWPLLHIVRAFDQMWEWRRRRRSRHQLMKLSDHMCKDIGISKADAWREGCKPFWKA